MDLLNEYKTAPAIRKVWHWEENVHFLQDKELPEERNLNIFVNGTPVGQMTCSPWAVREAVCGFLYVQGVLKSADQLTDLTARGADLDVTLSPPAEIIDTTEEEAAPVLIKPIEVLALAMELEDFSQSYRRTGGPHNATLMREGRMLSFFEDISRQAAIDKVIGDCLLRRVPMKDGVLVFSGRVPLNILRRAVIMGCSVVIALGTPTEEACLLAECSGITLIGFARETSFNVYTHPERVRETE